MKQPKRLTRAEKVMCSRIRLNPNNWMKVSEDWEKVILVHKYTGRLRKVYKN